MHHLHTQATRMLGLLIFACSSLFSGSTIAATISVDQNCNLVDAIASANSNVATNGCSAGDIAGTDEILIPTGTTTTLSTINNTTGGANALPVIQSDILIRPASFPGSAYLTRDPTAPEFRFFYIDAGGALELQYISLQNGKVVTAAGDAEKSGGAIYNLGDLVLDGIPGDEGYVLSNSAANGGGIYNGIGAHFSTYGMSFIGNSATTNGGAIYNIGTMTLDALSISSNTATGNGGAIFNSRTLSIQHSKIERSRSQNQGGAIYQSNGSLALETSTINDNRADFQGAGLYISAGNVVLSNSTITHNLNAINANALYNDTATINIINSTFSAHEHDEIMGGRGIINNAGSITFSNSIIANTNDSACGGPISIIDSGNNWFQDNTCGRTGDGDPMLGSLADNGGPTKTQALLVGSGAINAGNDAICGVAPISNLDQRGFTRPQALYCDIGAYEVAVHTDTIIVSSTCSISNAIESANLNQPVGGCAAGTDSGTDTIVLAENATFALNSVNNGLIIADGLNGLPVIESSIRIQGNSATIERQAGAPLFRFFEISDNAELILENLTLSNGSTTELEDESGRGGAIYNFGMLSLNNSMLTNNHAYTGGAIANELGSISLTNSLISSNSASGSDGGGGLRSEGGSVSIDSSTLSNNTSASYGGGLYTFAGGLVEISNSTISGNSADANSGLGGGVYIDAGSLQVINTSLISNLAATGGGLFSDAGAVSIANSVIAGHPASHDCGTYPGGTFTEPGPNWFEDESCTGTASGNPSLSSLVDNGGPTPTHKPLAGSGLIDAADDGLCTVSPVLGLDQRRELRPVGAHCDIGSVESDASGSVPTDEHSFFVLPLANGRSVIFEL